MKLNEMLTKGLKEITEEMDVAKVTPCADDNGTVHKIIIEYVPKEEKKNG